MSIACRVSVGCVLATLLMVATSAAAAERLRLIIETDAGGDPDDEQSLVRFLLYANEWDVEGIIANRPKARDGENKNPVRDGLGIVRRMLDAYGQVQPNLLLHDKRFPSREQLWGLTLPGYDDRDDGVRLVIDAVDKPDPRPVWFLNWGTDKESGKSSLRRALDRVLAERGREGYAKFKGKLRLSSDDQFGEHTWKIGPAFPFWVYPFRPDTDGGRWYHRFSPLTKSAGGFDLRRDLLESHGPLAALYPTNTTLPQKEGDSLTFLYLIPNGLGNPDHPEFGSWAGRFGKMTKSELFPEDARDRAYFCPNVRDTIDGRTNRDNTLVRWAAHLQNDFRARLDWCVKDYQSANHPPIVSVAGKPHRQARPGETLQLDASPSRDPDGRALEFQWLFYPEPTGYAGPAPQMSGTSSAKLTVTLPPESAGHSLHLIAIVTNKGTPPLTRYGRVIVDVTK